MVLRHLLDGNVQKLFGGEMVLRQHMPSTKVLNIMLLRYWPNSWIACSRDST
jgi:hypothetical protein